MIFKQTYSKATVTTRRTCSCVLSTCKNVGKRTASVRGEYRLRTESYGFGSTQTRRRTLSACNTFSTCGLRIYHTCVRVRATRVPRTAYERATYGLLYKDDLTGDCQLVSKMPRKAQKKSTRQDPKKRAAEDTRAASDDEVNRRCTHLQRASTACTRQRGNRTEIVRCKHVQLTYHLRNVRCTQPLTVRRVVQTTYVHLASDSAIPPTNCQPPHPRVAKPNRSLSEVMAAIVSHFYPVGSHRRHATQIAMRENRFETTSRRGLGSRRFQCDLERSDGATCNRLRGQRGGVHVTQGSCKPRSDIPSHVDTLHVVYQFKAGAHQRDVAAWSSSASRFHHQTLHKFRNR
ncbi:hypothetical protein Bbelb_018060 [Branchiostoma belcheri]|nr:hypothetical protein Bbelb_018060 [Branchiostoma belcheri]